MYKKMYYHLFSAVTDAVNENDIEKIKEILKSAQIETEEIFMNFEAETVELVLLD